MIAPFGILAPGRSLFGRGRAAEAAGLIAAIGSRVLVVHGRDGARAGWLLDGLSREGAATAVVVCPGEPDLDALAAALGEASAFRPEVVVGLGGGAALDLAKAVAALAPAGSDPLDHLEVVGRGLPLPGPPLPFVAIPTTSGTGAEGTKNAVIGVPTHRRKVSLRDDRMLARLALVDPALTDGCPRTVTLASGLDAITQLIEPFLSTRASPFTDALSRAAAPPALDALRRLMEAEDADARDTMAWASLSGGLALANAGLGAVHGLAGVIGGATGAPHGAICGALLPHVLRLHRETLDPDGPAGRRLAEAVGWLGAGGIDGLEEWSRSAGLPRLRDLGLDPATQDEIAAAAAISSSMQSDPSKPSREALAEVLRAAG